MKRKNILLGLGLAFFLLVFLCMPVMAQQTENIDELKQQIKALQKRVEELESKQQVQEQDDPWGFFGTPQDDFWDPFEEMRRMQGQMDRMFQNSFQSRGQSKGGMFSSNMSFDYDFDMQETEDGYIITFDMTGLDQDKVDIDINQHSITVKGEHSRKDTEENPNSYFSSSSYGSFMKTIPLPVDADTSKLQTEKEGDNLVIRLPKKKS